MLLITIRSKHVPVRQLLNNYFSHNTPNQTSHVCYSIKFDTNSNQYTIGNQVINFDNNVMEIAGKRYDATTGLMQLLTKKNADTHVIIEDNDDHKQILIETDAQIFDPSTKKVNSDRSEKLKIISNKLFPNLVKKIEGIIKNITFLPSDPISLIDKLGLTIASYTAGNNGEYNKINSILDELLKQKIITKNDYVKIMKKI
jgi:hypothetical protein